MKNVAISKLLRRKALDILVHYDIISLHITVASAHRSKNTHLQNSDDNIARIPATE